MSQPSPAPAIENATDGLAAWLFDQSLSLFISTYQHNRLLILSGATPETLTLDAYPFDRPMGIAVSRAAFRLATRRHIWEFQNAKPAAEEHNRHTIYRLTTATDTSYLDAHDLANTEDHAAVIVDTRHSCLRRIENQTPLEPIWHPPFISKLAPEDRCHLNGLATDGTAPRYVTAAGRTNQAEGWRNHQQNGGALIDIANNEIISAGLSMPHSPRIHRGRLWLLNAGSGELGYIEPSNSAFQPIAFCPGFPRGLAFHNQFAIVGLSQARRNRTFAGFRLDNELDKRHQQAFCGLAVIDIETQKIRFTLQFAAPLAELFDVQLLPGIRHPVLCNPRQRPQAQHSI